MEITNEVVYKRPLTLTGALQECQKSDKRISATETRLDIFLKNVSKNEELSNIKVSKYLGRGSSAVVFETSDGNILKLTETLRSRSAARGGSRPRSCAWKRTPLRRPRDRGLRG